MNCKNCGDTLRTDYIYCPACGAKKIRNRITFKNLWFDITEMHFNLDNTFLRTFLGLFQEPEVVIGGYIGGTRKKHLDPISYLGIALTLSGIFVLLLQKAFLDKIDFGILGLFGTSTELLKKITSSTLEISSFIYVLYIPILALSGWLFLNQKKYFFSEYLVVGIYTLAHYGIFSFPVSLLLLALVPEYYLVFAFPMILVMMLYATYVANRLNGWDIGRSILFVLIFIVGFFGISLLLDIILLVTGVMEIQDFIPKRGG
ncbi:MAG: DUF3667 domain-containing protein [Flavobacteriales bacterium]|nr:MAG: DUF3667 domain-containing protein [Flavobacteriales bacterium]